MGTTWLLRCLNGYGAAGALNKILAVFVFFALSAAYVQADPLRIIAFGDSLTQGYGLAQEDGFVPQMQKWVREQGREVVFINAGVSGDTTAGGAARIEWTLADSADAIVVTLGGNDVLRGLDPVASGANLDRIVSAAVQKNLAVLLIGLTAPSNYGPEYKAAFDAIYPVISERYGTLYAPSFFEGLRDETGQIDPSALREVMQADAIHPNAEGVRKIVQGLGPYILDLMDQAGKSS